MFRITEIHDPVSTLYKLEDESSGSFAIVVPTCGAILNAFSIHLPEGPLNVVQGYSEFSDFKQQAESLGFRSCKLSPFPCRLKNARYHFGEKNYRIDKFLLGQHALHGILYDAPFTCLSQSTDKDGAKLTCAYSYRGEESGYPFHFDIEVTYCLQVGSRLRITTQVKNQDQGIIPIADGWHPYFSFGDNINNLLLEFQSKELLEFDDDLIPTGNLFPYQKYGSLHKIGDTVFDHCFTLNFYECQPMIVLRDAEKKSSVRNSALQQLRLSAGVYGS